MSGEDRPQRMDAARARTGLTVQDLWLRYVALGGTADAFELDGYLQGLVPLAVFQQDVLAQALNEALDDDYRTYRIALSSPSPGGTPDDRLARIIEELVDDPPPSPGRPEPPGDA